jgi:regulator of sigma E protease
MIYINLLIIFLLIITIHEFGHYLAARLFNAKVTDFSIGFGKPIYQFIDKNSTSWKISMIPLGGYVKIKGLDTIFQNHESDNNEIGTFQSLSLIKKTIILLAGSFFNIISAWICLFFIMFFLGSISFSNTIGDIINDSPAFKNDLRKGDVIYSINSQIIKEFSDIPKAINKKKFIIIEIIRNNSIIIKNINLEFNKDLNKHILGISSTDKPIIKRFKFLYSLENSILFIPKYYVGTISYLKNSIKKKTITKELSGPIGMIKMADQLMLDKIRGILFLFVVISLFVGVFNLLPIPLLDGGHIVYFAISNIFSNKLPSFITKIYLTLGFAIISILFITVTFNDIFYK